MLHRVSAEGRNPVAACAASDIRRRNPVAACAASGFCRRKESLLQRAAAASPAQAGRRELGGREPGGREPDGSRVEGHVHVTVHPGFHARPSLYMTHSNEPLRPGQHNETLRALPPIRPSRFPVVQAAPCFRPHTPPIHIIHAASSDTAPADAASAAAPPGCMVLARTTAASNTAVRSAFWRPGCSCRPRNIWSGRTAPAATAAPPPAAGGRCGVWPS
eukprot:201779-Chlamydomonas_euryale.AAC.2